MADHPDTAALVLACREAGLDPGDAVPLRRHATSVYRIPRTGSGRDLIAKIAPSTMRARAERAIHLTRWLRAHDFPCVEPAEVSQPIDAGDFVVTFWIHYDQRQKTVPDASHLGRLLRQLHALPMPPVDLPAAAPLRHFADLVTSSTTVSDGDKVWLLAERHRLLADYAQLDFPLGVGMLHGDAYPGNTLWNGGTAILGDWDEPAIGPRELDLAPTLQGGIRFGRSSTELDAFTIAYGYDPRDWTGLPVLAGLRDLHTLGSFLRRAQHGDITAVNELDLRIASLRRRDNSSWRAA
ncbi:phosphotransferase enzyme family protein [Amycolatopsis thailandensis]|uniref:phosphotransferase enzyme family protein n=1 Tax=Amycolatopsis thailandensis TaxID=589330 RepID=UPI00362B48FF